MIFMAKVCPKAINFAIAESIHQFLVLRPSPMWSHNAMEKLGAGQGGGLLPDNILLLHLSPSFSQPIDEEHPPQ